MTEIDVLMPVRGPARWLKETLDGLAAQDHESWRLVVVLHGNESEIEAIIQNSGLPVRIVSADLSKGLSDVLNIGLSECTAEYVARLDADDVPLPNRLSTQHDALLRNPECALVASPALLIDEESMGLGRRNIPPTPEKLLRTLAWKNCIIHPAVMYRKESILNLGGYDGKAVCVEDYDLWLRLLARHDVCILDKPAVLYRIHKAQVTSTCRVGRIATRQIRSSRRHFVQERGLNEYLVGWKNFVWSFRQISRPFGP